MSIRLPLTTVLDQNDSGDVGAGSVSGGVAYQFFLPQDTDNCVVKLTASTVGGAVSAVFQTTDDGGTTWYDVGRTSIVSNTATEALAEWLSIPVNSEGINTQYTLRGGSVISGTIGSSAASTLSARQSSGLPVLSTLNRVFLIYTGNLTTNALSRVRVKVNSQTPGN